MIHISLRQLEYFVAAARHGGAAKAAATLNVSQPSISMAIADLEAMWEETLFVRLHARGLELTSAGSMRHREAHVLLEAARALEGPRSQSLDGVLRLGSLTNLAPRWLPGILARMRVLHPGIEIELHDGDTESMIRMLQRGAIDIALLYDMGLSRKGVRLEHVTDQFPYALLPWGHSLAFKGAPRDLKMSEIAREPLILLNLPHSREYVLSLFRNAKLTPKIAYETSSLEMVRSLVANGLGVSLLTTRPTHDRSYDGKRIACRDLSGPLTPQRVVLAWPEQTAFRSLLAKPFIEVTKSLIPSKLQQ